jgi:hypothetical protein
MARPNWGHGSKDPVLTFTEDEIREVMARHTPYKETAADDVVCHCTYTHDDRGYTEFDACHLLDELKEFRRGKHKNFDSHPAYRGKNSASPTH